MNDKLNEGNLIYGFIGLLAGVLIAGFFATYAVNNQHNGMMRMMGMRGGMMDGGMMGGNMGEHHDEREEGMSEMMDDMSASLENKTGDDFDNAFIDEMVIHHEGAVNMAEKALKNAQRQEIKDMASDIIDAQTKEITQMKNWQKEWYNK